MLYQKKQKYKCKINSLSNGDIYAMPKTYYEYASDNELHYKSTDKHKNGYEYVYVRGNDDGIYWLSDEEFHKKYKLIEPKHHEY